MQLYDEKTIKLRKVKPKKVIKYLIFENFNEKRNNKISKAGLIKRAVVFTPVAMA